MPTLSLQLVTPSDNTLPTRLMDTPENARVILAEVLKYVGKKERIGFGLLHTTTLRNLRALSVGLEVPKPHRLAKGRTWVECATKQLSKHLT